MAHSCEQEVLSGTVNRSGEYCRIKVETSIGSNDVLFCESVADVKSQQDQSSDSVVFFGGDVQDFEQHMKENKTFQEYGDFCLEAVCDILRAKYSLCNIIIIRPSQRNRHFSIFSNFLCFVDEYAQSVPFYKSGHACQHLLEILSSDALNKSQDVRNSKLHLIGFSRGVNVLNQMVYETDIRNKQNKHFVDALFGRIGSMYFLDGGNGCKLATLPNSDVVINSLVHTIPEGCCFHIYGTSYQWKDQQRPWIAEEMQYFVEILQMMQRQKKYSVHQHLYDDEMLDKSLVQHGVSALSGAENRKNKGIFRHFELLHCFNKESKNEADL